MIDKKKKKIKQTFSVCILRLDEEILYTDIQLNLNLYPLIQYYEFLSFFES